jgi:hypothetical protein
MSIGLIIQGKEEVCINRDGKEREGRKTGFPCFFLILDKYHRRGMKRINEMVFEKEKTLEVTNTQYYEGKLE